ncbi:MAG TPA: PhzF family phenazine biosynthesis protein [Solirubrobacterales bacterium]|nr:PhzF family phenazine biosynthesis protein [Solirubrobacterales bacterium]
MAELHVLRVFVNEDGEWGNPLGVFLEGAAGLSTARRQSVAAELRFSETVFVEDREGGIRIHTPVVEMPFAGHPCVGTAWLLAHLGRPVAALRVPAGKVGVDSDGGEVFVRAQPEWSPPFDFIQLEHPAAVRALAPPGGDDNVYAWAWIDEAAGTIRARAFVPGAGITEDEATGSATLALSARLSRPIVVHQGRGSVLQARPLGDGLVEIGGAAVLDEVRAYPLR